eukprot:Nk52_evm31s355 gene=Nk52_evmTU31s355
MDMLEKELERMEVGVEEEKGSGAGCDCASQSPEPCRGWWIGSGVGDYEIRDLFEDIRVSDLARRGVRVEEYLDQERQRRERKAQRVKKKKNIGSGGSSPRLGGGRKGISNGRSSKNGSGMSFGACRLPRLPYQNKLRNFWMRRSVESALVKRIKEPEEEKGGILSESGRGGDGIKAAMPGDVKIKQRSINHQQPLQQAVNRNNHNNISDNRRDQNQNQASIHRAETMEPFSSFKQLEESLFFSDSSVNGTGTKGIPDHVRTPCLVAETGETTYTLFPPKTTFTSIFGRLKEFCESTHVGFYGPSGCTLTAVTFVEGVRAREKRLYNDLGSDLLHEAVFGDVLVVCCDASNVIADFPLSEFNNWYVKR